MLTITDLEQLQAVDPFSVDETTLVDIQTVKINTELSKEQRILDFVNQIRNPYLYKCGGLIVQSVYANTEVTLTDRMKQYFRTI